MLLHQEYTEGHQGQYTVLILRYSASGLNDVVIGHLTVLC